MKFNQILAGDGTDRLKSRDFAQGVTGINGPIDLPPGNFLGIVILTPQTFNGLPAGNFNPFFAEVRVQQDITENLQRTAEILFECRQPRRGAPTIWAGRCR